MRFARAFLAAAAVLFLFAGQSSAADPAYIPAPVFAAPPKSAPLKFAAPSFCPCADGCDCPAGACPAGCPVVSLNGVSYYQVCEGATCRLVPVNSSAAPKSGPVFLSSGSCASGSCGIAPSYSGGLTMSPGSCGTAGPSGWWLGKNLGKAPPPWKK
jgi:hypothetical protein